MAMTSGINQLVGIEFTESQKVEVSLLDILAKDSFMEEFFEIMTKGTIKLMIN